ncbi:hypothetical protein K2X33_15465, partial [bacterium]|nr:hypothetical protein [bacterium]
MRWLFALIFCFCSFAQAADLPEYAQKVVTIVASARTYIQGGTLDALGISLLRQELEMLARRPNMDRFTDHAFGPGLLHLDGFREDLLNILRAQEDPVARERISELRFETFATSLAESSARAQVRGEEELQGLEHSFEGVLKARDRFSRSSTWSERALWLAHTVAIVFLGYELIENFKDRMEIDKLTTREYIGVLGSIWAANLGLYYWLA